MNNLPLEIIFVIVTYIQKITDKRQFTQTCNTYNNLTNPLIKTQELSIKFEYFIYPTNYCIEKFTLELCNDSYFDRITECYLCPDNKIIINVLTAYGQIDLLKIAMNNGCELFGNIRYGYAYECVKNILCEHAVMSGKIDMLLFVKSHGCQWTSETSDFSALCDHLHILKFLKENKCVPSRIASFNAAINGNYEMMRWLLENECEIHSGVRNIAKRIGNLDMLELFKTIMVNWDDDDDKCKYFIVRGLSSYTI
jgi:hypothetical protein